VLVALIIGGVILLAMIGVSWYGAVTLPSDARIPIHFGVSYNNFVPKRAGLIMHPAVGVVIYLILAFVGHSNSGSASSKTAPHFILPVVMCVLLVFQAGAIRVARRKSGG
jgi:hypothetical protein